MSEPIDGVPGSAIINAAWAVTGTFVASVVAGVVAPDTLSVVTAVVSVALAAVGVIGFVYSYAVGVGRSREEAVSVAGLYFLAGGAAPRVVRFRLLAALAVQVAAAFGGASLRPFTSLAFGVLVPLFGLGTIGVWAARHGTFEPQSPRR